MEALTFCFELLNPVVFTINIFFKQVCYTAFLYSLYYYINLHCLYKSILILNNQIGFTIACFFGASTPQPLKHIFRHQWLQILYHLHILHLLHKDTILLFEDARKKLDL